MDRENADTTLPLHGQPTEQPDAAPKVYVTLEEKAILDAMRELRSQAQDVRSQLAAEDRSEVRSALQQRLESLRSQRRELAARREAAYRRKMIMLGHIREDD